MCKKTAQTYQKADKNKNCQQMPYIAWLLLTLNDSNQNKTTYSENG